MYILNVTYYFIMYYILFIYFLKIYILSRINRILNRFSRFNGRVDESPRRLGANDQ